MSEHETPLPDAATAALRRLFAEAAKLPPDVRDALARRWLADLDELRARGADATQRETP